MIQDSELFTVDNLKDILKSFKIVNMKIDEEKEEIIFETENNKKITMFHDQHCCESVCIYSETNNLDVLIGKTIFDVTETVLDPGVSFHKDIEEKALQQYDSFTWTFYKFLYQNCDNKTESIEIIWFGASSGYYNEGVQFKCEDIKAD